MKNLILLSVLLISISVNAQQSYKYVIIPTHFNDFGNDLNPFGLSSAIQGEFDKHSIVGVFATDKMPDDYCETLTVNLVKISNLLRNKLKVELKDCMNRVVWSNEGIGRSKDFREGFGQAVADALKDLNQLPVNTTMSVVAQEAKSAPKIVGVVESLGESNAEKHQPEGTESAPKIIGRVNSAGEQSSYKVQAEGADAGDYKPVNPYYNGTYLLDVVESGNNKKELLVLNGEALGYKNRQKIATLVPSGLEDVFTINWIKSDGTSIRGVAKLNAAKLEISLNESGNEKVIVLQKL